MKKMRKITSKYDIKFTVNRFYSMPNIKCNYSNSDELMTYFTQEMLAWGFLAGGKIDISYKHAKKIIDMYIKSCDEIFRKMSLLIKNNKIPLKGQSNTADLRG